MIVVDASALLELLLQTPVGARVEARLFADDHELHAPHLLDVEIVDVSCASVKCRPVGPTKRSRISPTSIFIVTPT